MPVLAIGVLPARIAAQHMIILVRRIIIDLGKLPCPACVVQVPVIIGRIFFIAGIRHVADIRAAEQQAVVTGSRGDVRVEGDLAACKRLIEQGKRIAARGVNIVHAVVGGRKAALYDHLFHARKGALNGAPLCRERDGALRQRAARLDLGTILVKPARKQVAGAHGSRKILLQRRIPCHQRRPLRQRAAVGVEGDERFALAHIVGVQRGAVQRCDHRRLLHKRRGVVFGRRPAEEHAPLFFRRGKGQAPACGTGDARHRAGAAVGVQRHGIAALHFGDVRQAHAVVIAAAVAVAEADRAARERRAAQPCNVGILRDLRAVDAHGDLPSALNVLQLDLDMISAARNIAHQRSRSKHVIAGRTCIGRIGVGGIGHFYKLPHTRAVVDMEVIVGRSDRLELAVHNVRKVVGDGRAEHKAVGAIACRLEVHGDDAFLKRDILKDAVGGARRVPRGVAVVLRILRVGAHQRLHGKILRHFHAGILDPFGGQGNLQGRFVIAGLRKNGVRIHLFRAVVPAFHHKAEPLRFGQLAQRLAARAVDGLRDAFARIEVDERAALQLLPLCRKRDVFGQRFARSVRLAVFIYPSGELIARAHRRGKALHLLADRNAHEVHGIAARRVKVDLVGGRRHFQVGEADARRRRTESDARAAHRPVIGRSGAHFHLQFVVDIAADIIFRRLHFDMEDVIAALLLRRAVFFRKARLVVGKRDDLQADIGARIRQIGDLHGAAGRVDMVIIIADARLPRRIDIPQIRIPDKPASGRREGFEGDIRFICAVRHLIIAHCRNGARVGREGIASLLIHLERRGNAVVVHRRQIDVLRIGQRERIGVVGAFRRISPIGKRIGVLTDLHGRGLRKGDRLAHLHRDGRDDLARPGIEEDGIFARLPLGVQRCVRTDIKGGRHVVGRFHLPCAFLVIEPTHKIVAEVIGRGQRERFPYRISLVGNGRAAVRLEGDVILRPSRRRTCRQSQRHHGGKEQRQQTCRSSLLSLHLFPPESYFQGGAAGLPPYILRFVQMSFFCGVMVGPLTTITSGPSSTLTNFILSMRICRGEISRGLKC